MSFFSNAERSFRLFLHTFCNGSDEAHFLSFLAGEHPIFWAVLGIRIRKDLNTLKDKNANIMLEKVKLNF